MTHCTVFRVMTEFRIQLKDKITLKCPPCQLCAMHDILQFECKDLHVNRYAGVVGGQGY